MHVDWDKPVIIGNHVTVGHNACVHGCKIEDEVLIGIGANVLSGANISKHCIVGAGSVVRENQLLEEGFLYAGVPAKKIRALTEEEKTNLKKHAVKYSELSNEFKKDKVKKLLKLM